MPESNYREVLDLVKNRSNVFIDTSTVPVYFGEEYPNPLLRGNHPGMLPPCGTGEDDVGVGLSGHAEPWHHATAD